MQATPGAHSIYDVSCETPNSHSALFWKPKTSLSCELNEDALRMPGDSPAQLRAT